MSTYCVGDIQGCFDELQALLHKLQFDPAVDELWVAGDLVNRGKQSLETLRFLKNLGERCKVVLGNHDLHLLAIAYGAQKIGLKDTFDDVLNAPDAEDLLQWLRFQPLLFTDKGREISVVHAGIPPSWSVKKAHKLAGEVETVLRGDEPQLLFDAMYGNEPACWDKTLQGGERLRVITNYLTRMRFCDAAGVLDLESKSSKTSEREGFLPWFAHAARKTRDNCILFGHWAALEGEAGVDGVYALDTGCVWGGALTAIDVDSGIRTAVACEVAWQ